MKKLAFAAAVLLVGAGLMTGPAADRDPGAGLYPLNGTVTGLDQDADVVTFTDGAGNDWEFYGTEDWMIGDGVAALMDDNGTAIVTDDVIVSARYAG